MIDPILASFLEQQYEDAMVLHSQSDCIDIRSLGAMPPQRYLATLYCPGFVLDANGEVQEVQEFHVGISFSDNFLRAVSPFEVITLLHPKNCFHPNVRAPLACIGRIQPGCQIVEILHRLVAVLSWNNTNVSEDNALNSTACEWGRQHQDRYPLPMPPLRRRALKLKTRDLESGEKE